MGTSAAMVAAICSPTSWSCFLRLFPRCTVWRPYFVQHYDSVWFFFPQWKQNLFFRRFSPPCNWLTGTIVPPFLPVLSRRNDRFPSCGRRLLTLSNVTDGDCFVTRRQTAQYRHSFFFVVNDNSHQFKHCRHLFDTINVD